MQGLITLRADTHFPSQMGMPAALKRRSRSESDFPRADLRLAPSYGPNEETRPRNRKSLTSRQGESEFCAPDRFSLKHSSAISGSFCPLLSEIGVFDIILFAVEYGNYFSAGYC
jgi:hypothetical protein